MSVVRNLCRQLAILEHGRIAVSGSVEEVFRRQPDALKNLIGDEGDESPDVGDGTAHAGSPDEAEGARCSRVARPQREEGQYVS
jgi:D-methionine transport system ATP-binding protein